MSFQVTKSTDIQRRERSGGGTTRYSELAQAVGNLDVGYAVSLKPVDVGVDVDMSDADACERFRSNIAAAMNRHVSRKLGMRLRVYVDATGQVQIERMSPSATSPVRESAATETFDEV